MRSMLKAWYTMENSCVGLIEEISTLSSAIHFCVLHFSPSEHVLCSATMASTTSSMGGKSGNDDDNLLMLIQVISS